MASNIVVVTGASGYIGCHIVSNLLSRGRHVRATVRDSSDPDRVAHLEALEIRQGGSLEIVEMDLFDGDSVNKAIAGAEEVIHTAAAVMIMSSNPQLKIVLDVNQGWESVDDALSIVEELEKFNILVSTKIKECAPID